MNVRFLPVLLSFCLLSLTGAERLSAQAKGSTDLRLNTVVIDPGHGGKDPGTVSADKKTMEKTLALKISRMFAARLREAYPGMKVVMTRDKDVFIPLNTRAKIASDADANLFISIHINAIARKSVNGFAAYILGPSVKSNYDSYEVNMEVCKRENSVIYLEDDYSTTYKDLDDSPESQILLQLMQNAFREQSLSFAETVSKHMGKTPFKKNWGVMQGNIAVLRRASMPAVLLEFGFMTNTDDLAILRSEEKIRIMVDRLFAAFAEYKADYDKSVAIAEPAAAKKEGETKAAAESGTPSGVFYGTQVLASSKKMAPGDKFFKGFETRAVRVGTLYKYVAGPDADPGKARENFARIKKVFPDAFFVKVEDGQITRQK